MRVSYSVNGKPFGFEAQEEDDLRTLSVEITERVQAQHAELEANTYLPILITNGLLDSLADDAEEVALGELTGKG